MMWYKNFTKNLIFDVYMLFIVFYCKAVSKEGCDIKIILIAKSNFLRNQVSDQFYFFICLGNWELKL